jgi:hypothetical protein
MFYQSQPGYDSVQKRTRIVLKNVSPEMSLSKKRAEMEQVNPSLQNTEKRHRKDSLILERSFFPF